MTYADNADIAKEFRKLTFDGDSAVTEADIDGFLEESEAIINSYVSNRYIVPITGIEALKIMKTLEIAIVALRVQVIIDLKAFKSQSKETKQEFGKQERRDWAIDYLQGIQKGLYRLIDAEEIGSSSGITSFNSKNNIKPFFRKEIRQW